MSFKESSASESFLKKFSEDGYAVVENFLSEDDICSLRSECADIVNVMDPNEHKTVFSTVNPTKNIRDHYFITSADQVRFFFEESALDDKGHLLVEKHLSINKIGHALHFHCPAFKRLSHSEKILAVLRSLGFVDPVLMQSMYIFKQPAIGGKVTPHQDGSYLFTEPMERLVGFWFALEDCTIENGCLSFIPGSHKSGLHGDYRLVRQTQEDGSIACGYDGVAPEYDPILFVPCPVKKGSLVLINGLVVHQSECNKSDKSRHIYTFHVYDAAISKWDERNWLQPTTLETFDHLFQDE